MKVKTGKIKYLLFCYNDNFEQVQIIINELLIKRAKNEQRSIKVNFGRISYPGMFVTFCFETEI